MENAFDTYFSIHTFSSAFYRYLINIRNRGNLFMKKSTKAVLHLILAGIVSVMSYLGFKKGVESVSDKMKDE